MTVIVALSLAGCATAPVKYQPVQLPLPEKPLLPTVAGTELQCLSDPSYVAVKTRDRLQAKYVRELEAVICTTRKKPCP